MSPWQRVGEPLGTPRRGAAVTGGVYSQLLPLGARQPGSLNRSEAVRAPWLDRSRRAPSCYQRRADEPSAAVITTAPSCPSPTTCTGTGSTRRPALQQLTPVGQLKKKKKKAHVIYFPGQDKIWGRLFVQGAATLHGHWEFWAQPEPQEPKAPREAGA